MLYCILYAVMLNFIGFAVSTVLFLALSMLTLNHEKKLRTLWPERAWPDRLRQTVHQ